MRSLTLVSSVCLSALCFAGCGGKSAKKLPELGAVTGVVELDGKPVPDAIVMFEPKGSGTLASAGTDTTGKYQLMYRPDVAGAALGEHVVRISKREGDAGPETLPKKFNDKTELTANVQAGANTIDFKLHSK